MLPRRYQRLKQVLNRRQPDLTVLMERVHKPHNLSAILRTCDAVGVFEVHAVNVADELPTYNQVAQGSEKWVHLRTHSDIKTEISHLKQRGFNIYAAHLSDDSVDYRNLNYTQPTAILLGAEKWGVSEEAAALVDGHIIIPMVGMVQSLNVSVAAAVILFEAQRQRLEVGFYDRVRLDPETYKRVIFEWGYPELAALYRQKGEPYPNLGSKGEILS
ncbi:MAG: tRNA (guanosine(18)-2'-O)-methyltransferase TrmH [Xenococcaceae cyanobacterium]